jgi:acyl-coenzyme A thioesterase PaaI-like protein
MHAPDLSGPPDWTPARLPHLIYAHPDSQFLVGEPAEGRVCVRYFQRPDGHLGGKVWFGPRAEGPPGHAHGGAIAAVLDEVMGGAAWLAGHPVMTIDMAVRYRKAVPLNQVYTLHGGVERVEGRKVHMVGSLLLDDRALATSTGVFLVMTRNPFAGLKA